jgi:hypothetical protein
VVRAGPLPIAKFPPHERNVSEHHRSKRRHAEAKRADDAREETLNRRRVLGGLAAVPVLYSIGSAASTLAAPATQPGSVPDATDCLVRAAERRYNAPLLTTGTRLSLPADITVNVAPHDIEPSHPRPGDPVRPASAR